MAVFVRDGKIMTSRTGKILTGDPESACCEKDCKCPRDITDISSVTLQIRIQMTDTTDYSANNAGLHAWDCNVNVDYTKSKTWTRVNRFNPDGSVIGDPGPGEFQMWWDTDGTHCNVLTCKNGDGDLGIYGCDFGTVVSELETGGESIPSSEQDPVICGRPDGCRTTGGYFHSLPCDPSETDLPDYFTSGLDYPNSATASIYYDPDSATFYLALSHSYSIHCSMGLGPGFDPCGDGFGFGYDPAASAASLAALIGSYTFNDSRSIGSMDANITTVVTIA